MSRILYTGTKNASSWALRAWLALRELNIDFEERVVDIRRPQRIANLARIAEFSAPGAVPVLVDADVVIFDSLAIMEYANDIGGQTLLPANARQRGHARSLMAWVHAGMSNLCSGVSFESSFHAVRRPLTDIETGQAERVFNVWEQELSASGGPFLVGSLSLADLSFVPVVRRLVAPDTLLAAWPRTRLWAERLMQRETVREWMQVADSLPPVEPAE
jgi:glutathione S-transferase